MKKRHRAVWALIFIIVIGSVVVVWFDAACEWLRNVLGGDNTKLFVWSSVALGVLVLVGFRKKIWGLIIEQLGG